MKRFLLSGFLLFSVLVSYGQGEWEKLPHVFSSYLTAFHTYDNQLFIGGNFTQIDGQRSMHSAVYSGGNITRHQNSQQGGGGFDSFTEYNGRLIGGGSATVGSFSISAAMVLEWDGTSWGNSSLRLNHNVRQVITFRDTLFAAMPGESTSFAYAGYYAGSGWHQAGGELDAMPFYITYNDNLYAYGDFTESGDASVKYFAKWENEGWVQAGSGEYRPVAPVVFQGKLYAFALESTDFGARVHKLIEWNGSDWEVASDQKLVVSWNNIRAVTADEDNIYVVGDLAMAGDKAVKNAARFDGNEWHPMGEALDDVLINALHIYDGYLYAGSALDFDTREAYLFRFPLNALDEEPDDNGDGSADNGSSDDNGGSDNGTADENGGDDDGSNDDDNTTSVGLEEQTKPAFFYDYQNRSLVFEKAQGYVWIYKSDGRMVWDGMVSSNQLVGLHTFSDGLYIVKYQNGSLVDTKKVIVY
ncbi:T9SS type A sorting domain-containing protein [Cytophagaceae bacterium ABcell3]|nr:T9SS type A sorting domain-containing protein [Cytophagaceae bacterium ABcell3]